MPQPREIPWDTVMSCFGVRPHEARHKFTLDSFRPEYLQSRLDERLGLGVVDVPARLYTSGYADHVERARYARETVVPALAALGVTVTDVPPRDPVQEKYYHGPGPGQETS